MQTSSTPILRRLARAARRLAAACLLLGLGQLAQPNAQAAPAAIAWPTIHVTLFKDGFTQPVHVTHAGDGSGRLFVVEQRGIIKIVQNGATLATPFLNISSVDGGADRVRTTGSEEGLLSVAFPPGFPGAGKDHFYVYYTSRVTGMDGDNVVARYKLKSGAPNEADPASEQIVLHIPHPAPHDNHNGGQLQFGPADGYLYISVGDGGGDQQDNAQNKNNLLGTILRIDVETSSPITYTVPATNPFVGAAGLDEIWAWGLRNPWRMSFDRASHDLYIGDVGQNSWEEVNYQPAASAGGENYGWRCYEGFATYNTSGCGPPSNYTFPATSYARTTGDNRDCAVTGGFVYRGANYPRLHGIYFYGDYCSGKIRGLKFDGEEWQTALLRDTTYNISSFGEDQAGNLYFAHLGGAIYMIKEEVVFLPFVLKN